jgi:hypothetical protein
MWGMETAHNRNSLYRKNSIYRKEDTIFYITLHAKGRVRGAPPDLMIFLPASLSLKKNARNQ